MIDSKYAISSGSRESLVLLDDLASKLGINKEIAIDQRREMAIANAQSIYSSYKASKSYLGSHEKASESLINTPQFNMDGKLNEQTLKLALDYVNRTNSLNSVKIDETSILNTPTKISTPNAIYDSKVAGGQDKQETYSHGKTRNVIYLNGRQNTGNKISRVRQYDWRTAAKRAVAGVAAGAALFVALSTPFARINPSYAEQQNGQGVEDSNYGTNKSLGKEVGGLGFRVAHNVTSETYQIAAATSPTPDPSTDPLSAKSAHKTKTLIGILKEQGVKGDYSHETDEIRQFREGKIKYGDASEGTKMWFGIPKKRPKLNFEHKGDNYRMYVEMGINKKLHDLDGLLAGVKVGGKWYFAFDPKERDYVSLNNKEYGALKGKRVTQVILYRNVKGAEGNDVMLIGGSWVYEGLKKERVAGIEKPKFEPEKVVPLKQKKGSGGKLLEPIDFTAPHRAT